MRDIKIALSVKEAARAVSLSPWTIRKFIKIGKIKPTRLGRRITIELAELQRFLKGGRE